MHSPQSSEAEPNLATKSSESKNKKQTRNDTADVSKVESTKNLVKKSDAKQEGALLSRISNSEDNSCKPENKGQISNNIFQDKAAPTQWSSLLCKHYLFGRCARKRCRFLHAEPPVNPFVQLSANPDNDGGQNTDINRRLDDKQNGSVDNQTRHDDNTHVNMRDRSTHANSSVCGRGQQSHFKTSRTVLVSNGSTSPNQYHNPQRCTSENMLNSHSEQQKVMPPPPNNINSGKKNQNHYYSNNTLESPPPPPASHMANASLNVPPNNTHQASPYAWLRRKPDPSANHKIGQLHPSLLPNMNSFGMPEVHDHAGIIRQYPQYNSEPLVRDSGPNSRRNFAYPQNVPQKMGGNSNTPLLPTSTTLSDIRFVKAAETLADKYNIPFVCVYFPSSGYLIQFTSPKNPLVDQRVLYQKNSGMAPQVPYPPQRYPPNEGHAFENELLMNENNAERPGNEGNCKDDGHNRHIEELLKSMSLCQPLVHQAKHEESLNTHFDTENQSCNQDISLLNSKPVQMNSQLLGQPPSSQRLSVDRFRAVNSNGENPIKMPQVSVVNKDGMQSIGEPTTAPADDEEQILSMVSCNSTESGANRCSSSHSGFFIDSATEESNNACNGYACDPNCSKPNMFMLGKTESAKTIWQPAPPPPPPHEPPKNVIPANVGGLYNQMPLQPPQQPFWLPSLDALEGECAPQWARQRHNEGIDMNTYAVKSTESSENAWALGSKHLFAAFQDVKMVPEGSCHSGNIKGNQTCGTTCLTNHANMGDLAQLSPTAALIAAIWGAEEQQPSQIPTHSK